MTNAPGARKSSDRCWNWTAVWKGPSPTSSRPAWAAMGLALLYTTLLSPFFVLYQLDATGIALNVAPIVLLVCTVIAARIAIANVEAEDADQEVHLASS